MDSTSSTDIYDVVDVFAGPGGWDVAAQQLGLKVMGIEWDHAACETRRAYGLHTAEGDVRQYGPKDFPARGFIASPPCQSFSMAGNGAGRLALDHVLAGVAALAARDVHDASVFTDERTALVLEPLRWMLEAVDAGVPFEWACFEQVPTVLPVWAAMAEVLRGEGYSVATGYVSAEEHGVAQTRKRAVLVARRDSQAHLPSPTHQKYRKGVARGAGDPSLKPWVTMRDVLGDVVDGVALRSNYSDAGKPGQTAQERGRTIRGVDSPSVTLTSKPHSWVLAQGVQAHSPRRDADSPAATLAFGHDAASVVFVPADVVGDDLRAAKADGRATRVTVDQAGQLQSFPAGYPWQGKRGKQYEQVGNAVPPMMAAALIRAATA